MFKESDDGPAFLYVFLIFFQNFSYLFLRGHLNVYLRLKVGSCPNDDNFVQIYFCPFLCSI